MARHEERAAGGGGGGAAAEEDGAAAAAAAALRVPLLQGAGAGPTGETDGDGGEDDEEEGAAAAAAARRDLGGGGACGACGRFLRWARRELLAFLVLVVVGVVMGLTLPRDAKLVERDPSYATLSNILGWTYFLAWGISFFPQIYINYRRKTTVGLSLDFELLNLLGFCCYAAFAAAFYASGTVQRAYEERHDGKANKVAVQDLVFAVHAAAITLVTIVQMFFFDGLATTVRTRLSKPVSLLLLALGAGIALGAVLAATAGGNDGGAWLQYLYFVSYVKLFISTVKGIPQAYLNYQRQSTVGWSIHNILCDFTGGLLSVLQLVLDCWATDDWGGIKGDPLKFGLGLVSMGFDLLFFVQHFILYPEDCKTKADGAGARSPSRQQQRLQQGQRRRPAGGHAEAQQALGEEDDDDDPLV